MFHQSAASVAAAVKRWTQRQGLHAPKSAATNRTKSSLLVGGVVVPSTSGGHALTMESTSPGTNDHVNNQHGDRREDHAKPKNK